MQELKCKNCGAAIGIDNVRTSENLAVCPACGSVFYISEKSEIKKPALKTKIPMPQGFTISDNSYQFSLTRKWFSPVIIFMIFFALFCNY